MDLIKIIKSYIFTCDFCKNPSDSIICNICLKNFQEWSGCFFCNGFCICKFFSLSLWKYDIHSSNAILKFKYCNALYYSDFFGILLSKKIIEKLYDLNIFEDILIVPVPTSRLRLFQRGYNQSVLLVKSILKYIPSYFKIKKDLFFFSRQKYSIQKNKDSFQRQINANTINLNKNNSNHKYKLIIIVDDLIASGSTILKCYELASKYAENFILTSIAKT